MLTANMVVAVSESLENQNCRELCLFGRIMLMLDWSLTILSINVIDLAGADTNLL